MKINKKIESKTAEESEMSLSRYQALRRTEFMQLPIINGLQKREK